MRNNRRLALSAVALSILTVTSAASYASQAKINKVNKSGMESAQSTTLSFADWRAQQMLEKQDFTDRLIVKYKNKKNGKAIPPGLAKKAGLSLKHEKILKNGHHIISFGKEKNIKDVKTMINRMKKDSSIEFIEPDYKRFLMAQNQPWGIAQTQSDQLTDNDGANMTVCIIDSGYEQANPDLNANNASGTNNSGTGNWYQNGGSHGTHVAGTIAGVNNSEGVVGIMPNTNVNLHIVKVFNEAGWGYVGELSDAVDTCVNNGAKVINMSLGGAGSSVTEKNALQAAADSGVLLVAASGNDGNTTLSYPASYDAVMAVGALDSNNQHAEFSQYTPQVEISAPGEAVLSTVAGDGRLGFINLGSTTYANDIVPQTHYIESGGSFIVSNVDSSANGVLASCTLSGSSYSCSNVAGNICLAERNDNQKGSNYPEINPAKACADAGASGVIVYSDSTRPGLQNPFLVDSTNAVSVPSVSVSRALGQQLLTQLGSAATLTVNRSQNYAYYNGTSMATPHVTGVAAIVWSNNIDCSADEVRSALKSTAIDLDVAGRDDKTGFGLVQAKAASDALATTCGGSVTPPPPPTGDDVLSNGTTKTGLASSTELSFTMEVPAGATDLTFDMAGGTGDADLYVKFGSAPTSTSYDCRPYAGGNSESCPISTAQAGTYYVKVVAYSAFSGVNLTGSFTEPTTGGGATGGSASLTDISVARQAWTYYTINVPAGMATLDFTMSGGTGDADLYIRRGAQPTSSTYDCRPYKGGNNEVCSFTSPVADTWHIGIYGYSAASGVSLDVVYNP
ncbi:S8 family serine peptidase [Colwellia sp. BRX10-6]|uniref:S8 family serine peptidase n=1 Tax=unclassified Colwellia TaxID=196834 RepID=UPI0015F4940C|nr:MULTISPECIES: S8 family serine peptidase [unclassified Colwellia]MBA6382602.1 S8 family serine peptidase [Colwellia sp. BRX10-9]MBA6392921.1 S8 family serine peptidase [Colwellia sp. BRX10-6]